MFEMLLSKGSIQHVLLIVSFFAVTSANGGNSGNYNRREAFVGAYTAQLQPPRFSMHPSAASSIVREGTTKILQCLALGYPQPKYKWFKNGHPVSDFSSESFYKIHNTQRDDVGAYQCLAKNDVGAIYSEKNHITVAYMGLFLDATERVVFVEHGGAAILDLPPIESFPEPSVIWQDENGQLRYDHKYAVSKRHQLVILSCSKEDERPYRVRAINTQLGKEENSPFIQLKVSDDPYREIEPEIIIKPEDTKVVKGQELTDLYCIANARPLHELETLWFKDGVLIDYAGISYNLNDPWNRTLGLVSANLTHTGTYTCQVRLRTGGYPTIMASASVTVLEKPMFQTNLKTETLAEFGSSVTLDCDVQGNPMPGISWYRDGKRIGVVGIDLEETQNADLDDGNGRYKVEIDRSLLIREVKMEDMSIFQCVASNEAGEASIYTWLKIKTTPPVMQIPPANLTVLDGKDATITCRAIGAPAPNVTWLFNGAPLATGGRLQVLDEGDLLVSSTMATDSGKYNCIRANSAGRVSGHAHLTVLVRTQIVSPPVDTRVLLGHTATLTCGVSSDPNVHYNVDWFHEKQLMVPGSRVWVTEDGSLHVSAVRASDAGDYSCVVTSSGGNQTRQARVWVVELPFAPSRVSANRVEAVSARAVNVSWTPPFDGNSPIQRYIVQKRIVPEFGPVPDPLMNWVTEVRNTSATARWVLLTNLKAATSYQFRVSAVNAVGEGEPSEPTDVLTLPQEAPSGPPVGFVGSARSSTEIIIQWQPPLEEHRNGQILGYMVRYRLFGYDNSPWMHHNITNEAQRNYLIQDLITWKDYVVQVAAYNDKGVGVYTEGTKIKTKEGVPEDPPDNVTAEPLNSTAVTVSWTPPNPQKINGINQGYKIEAWIWDEKTGSPMKATSSSVAPDLLDPRAPQCAVLDGLNKFTTYNISVTCFTNPGDGKPSPFVLVTTSEDVPDEVTDLHFDEISDRSVRVSWSPPKSSNGILLGYHITYEVKDKPETLREEDLPPNITSTRIEHLQAVTEYWVSVAGMTAAGRGPVRRGALTSGVEPVPPGSPTTLALSNIRASSVLLQFTPGHDGNSSITRWTVEAQTGRNSSWVIIYEENRPESQSVLVPTLHPYTTYRLRVIAHNVAGNSPPSEACKEFQTLQAPPAHAPRNVTVRALSHTHLRVRWVPLQQSEWYGNPRGYNITYRLAESDESFHVAMEDQAANSHVIGPLRPWTKYEIRMAAINEVGSSEFSPPALERTRESVPSMGPNEVRANATSSTTVVVVWNEVPSDARHGMLDGYKVCYAAVDPPPRQDTKPDCKVLPSNQTRTVTLTELRKYVLYQIHVLAYTRLGDGALSDPPVTVRTHEDTPGPPSNVSFPDVTYTTARIIWDVPDDPNGEILAYKVVYHLNTTTQVQFSREFLPSDRTFRATELSSERYYLFSVRAQTRIGWGAAARALVLTTSRRSTPSPPSAPRPLTSLLQSHHATVSWTPAADGYAPLRYYTIQQKEEDGVWQTIPERVDPVATSYTANGLKPFTRYQFRLRATNDIGPSPYSNSTEPVRTLAAAPTMAVTSVSVVPITRNSVRVSWNPLPSAAWAGDSQSAGYRIYYQPLSDFPSPLQPAAHLDVLGSKSDSDVLEGLSAERNYEVSVRAFNSQGEGARSQPQLVWVGEAVPTAAPDNLAAKALSPTEVALAWNPPDSGALNGDLLGYKIFYLVTESPEEPDPTARVEEEIEVAPPSATHHNLVFLDKYTEYRIQMVAFNPAGDGPRSNALRVRTPPAPPSAPRNLTFTEITMAGLTVTWKPPARRNGLIEAYMVSYETVDGDEEVSKQVKQKVTSTELTVNGLEEEREYSFAVRAMTAGGIGPEATARAKTGPQPGSPSAPRAPTALRTVAAVHLRWRDAPSGAGPLLGYYIHARRKDDSRWETIAKTNHGMMDEFTISYQSLLPSTAYTFRIIAYNSFGVSPPATCDEIIVTPSKLYLEYGYLQYRPFYRQTWFMVALAATSVVIIISVIAVLCVKSKSYKYKHEAQKSLEESLAMEGSETRSLGPLERSARAPGRSPPRPAPAAVPYHSDEDSRLDESSLTDKPSELSSTDDQNSESDNESVRSEPHSFVNHYANVNDTLRQSWKRQKPVRNYSSYTDSEPEASAALGLNGGHVVMNNMARSRAPLPGFSSFV